MKNTYFPPDQIEKVKVQSLQQQVYEKIRYLILTNRLRGGQPINISQLAQDLGVSPTPVREALTMLKLDGLVEMDFYKTPQVSSLSESDIRDTYEMRMVLEGWAVRQVAQSLPLAEVEEMEKMILEARERSRTGDLELYVDSDVSFHELLTSKVSNQQFLRMYGTIQDLSIRIRTLNKNNTPECIEAVTEEHLAVLQAVRDRDPEKAQRLLRVHLENSMQRNFEHMEANDPTPAP